MYRLGIDLGGTNIVAGVVDENYKIVGVGKRKTNCPRPADLIIDDMVSASLEAIKNAGLELKYISSFGVGAPGAIDSKNGIVCYSNNMDFYNVPMAQMLKDRLGVDFTIENDANAAAYGEYIAGAGKTANNFIAITLGTGVGSGIIIDGKIFSGSNFAGAEIGHSVIIADGEKCTCGRCGCWEAYASATALIRQTKAAMTNHKDSLMWSIVNNNINEVDGLTAFEAMRQGDTVGKNVVDKYINYIAIGIVNCVNIFQPDTVCIGGGVSKEGELLTKPISDLVKRENFARNIPKQTEIKVAALGNDAGIIGAAFLKQNN